MILSNTVLCVFICSDVSAFSIEDAAKGGAVIIDTYDRVSNKYFYAALSILLVSFPALAKLKQGGQMRPKLSRAVAGLIHTANFVCLLFLVIHFAPEMNTVFGAISDILERMLG